MHRNTTTLPVFAPLCYANVLAYASEQAAQVAAMERIAHLRARLVCVNTLGNVRPTK
jgi:hypothetical protein